MSLANSPLPPDPEALRIFAADLQAELARKEIELAANAAEIHAKTCGLQIGQASRIVPPPDCHGPEIRLRSHARYLIW